MKKLICAALLFIGTYGIAQSKNDLWKKNNGNEASGKITKSDLPQKNIFDLDLSAMKSMLAKSPKRNTSKNTSTTIITLPNGEGKMENFQVYENPVMSPELAAKYPEIKSYIAIGVDNPNARAYFSNSPLGFKSMALYPNKETVFIEPVNADNTAYAVYKKSDKKNTLDKFECGVVDAATQTYNQSTNILARGADDGKLRTFRLAISCTGEYASYFGGTKALALAGMVNTMTRVNGIFERDFAVRLVLIANNDNVIYTDASTDPYSIKANWPNELQSNLTSVIGEANYDIGHLFDSVIGGGDAGCKGCIGVDGYKGRGYTSTLQAPEGDGYDIQYVAHEMGHQLGANHTFTYKTETGNPAQLEPGSASTIMGYAGVTIKDIQQHADDYFHAISIQQVTDNIKTKTCGVVTSTGNATPVVNAGIDYTIPKGTPFMLTGSASDSNTADILTYTWEQMDLGDATTTVPSATAVTGPLFRSYPPNSSATRYFPTMNTILAGLTTTSGYRIASETLPTVARTLNFRLTARDNRAGGSANNTDDMVVTVNGVAGPFTVDSQNSAVTYTVGSTQSINWTVAGTDANGVNCANVDILLSTDGGQTFPITLLAGTPNDGSQSVVIPNVSGTTNRIMVKGSGNIFFDVNNVNFTISGSGPADATAPTASTLSASGTTTSSTNLSWTAASDNVGVAGYNVYQNGVLKTTTTATSLAVTGLSASTTYNFYVTAKDATGNVSSASNTVTMTTSALADSTAPTASTLSASGTTTSSTNLTWNAATDNVGVAGYNVYQNGVLKTTTTATSLAVTGLSASTTYNFYVMAKDATGNVSSASNTVTMTTLSTAVSYCSSIGGTSKEYINRVQLGTINNPSGNNNGYGNYTSLSTSLPTGSVATIIITPGWNGMMANEAYAVWIDYNQNGNFDANEQVFSKSKTKSSTVSGSFTVPTSALIGTTRMRVSMKYNIVPTACEVFASGEVEDYTINILQGTTVKFETSNETADETATETTTETDVKTTDNSEAINKETGVLSFNLYPNPVKGETLYFSGIESNASYKIFNLMGQQVANGQTSNNSVNVSSLSTGAYIIQISDSVSVGTKKFIRQ